VTIPLIIPSSSTADGISLSTYRRRLAEEIGVHMVGTTTTPASGLEAERYVVSLDVRSDTAPPGFFDGLYLYVTTGAQAGVQRRLVGGGFEGPAGALVVDYPFDAALASGVTFELSALPAVTYLGLRGMNVLLNRALEELPLVDKLPIAAVTAQREYSLASYDWPIKAIRDVYEPRLVATDPLVRAPRGWRLVLDGEAPTLVLDTSYTTGDTFYIEVTRPASTRIRASGAWGDTSSGLSADTDEALYDAKTVVNMALGPAKRTLALSLPASDPARGPMLAEAEVAAQRAIVARFYNGFRGDGAQRSGVRSAGSWSGRWWRA
jgi:hypothetical protein